MNDIRLKTTFNEPFNTEIIQEVLVTNTLCAIGDKALSKTLNNQISETYVIPSIIYPRLSKFDQAFYFIGFVFLLGSLVSFISITESWSSEDYNIISFLVLGISCYFLIFYLQFSKKEFVKLTDTSLVYKTIWKQKSIDWERIDSVDTFHAYKRGTQLRVRGSVPMDEIFFRPEEIIIDIGTKFANISEDKMIHTINKAKALKLTAELWK